MNNARRALSALEYTAFIALIIVALLGISNYLVSSLGSKWRGVGDIFGHGRQYSPSKTTITE